MLTRALERLDAAIAELETKAPGWQAVMDLLRVSPGQGNVDDWPAWCLLPGEAPYAIATADGLVNSEVINTTPVDQMSAIYAWLQGKNIWQVDPDMATALLRTEMDVEIPIDVLYYLPMWGPYILAPEGCSDWPPGVLGIIVYLDWGMDNSLPMLRLLVDYGEARWESVPLIMRSRSIAGMLDDTIQTAQATSERFGIDGAEDTLSDKTEAIRAAIAIALYSCSRQRDIADPVRPGADLTRPQAVGRRYLPRRIEVGYRVGAAIRRSPTLRSGVEDERGGATRASTSPHLRAAHRHMYYSGAGSRRDPSLWLKTPRSSRSTCGTSTAALLASPKRGRLRSGVPWIPPAYPSSWSAGCKIQCRNQRLMRRSREGLWCPRRALVVSSGTAWATDALAAPEKILPKRNHRDPTSSSPELSKSEAHPR